MPQDNSFEVRQLIGRLRFRHLQLLVVLRDAGSLHSAALELNLTQPALSKALAEVEAAFGCLLFLRSSRGVKPTLKGELAIQGAAQLISELVHLGTEVSSPCAAVVLRIGAPPFVSQGYLPDVLKRILMQSEPRVRVQLEEGRVPLLVQMLLQGKLDVLITSYPTEMPSIEMAALQFEKLFDATFAVVAPAAHPLGKVRCVTWDLLAGESWILPSERSVIRQNINVMFQRAGMRPPTALIESTNPLTNVRLVADGLGLAAVPLGLAHSALNNGEVVRLNVNPPIPDSPVALVYRTHTINTRVTLLRRALGQI
jgi:DNA-binding transcriptional LysR family regulator